ncbi:MAG: hypothetical protein HY335_06780 [Deinococcus sp.]|nr:hypothetical protein [Deinococcus sp.]
MSKRYHAVVVSTTHWDRAWYAPFQEFRARLVSMIDWLIDTLDSNPVFTSFTLDGQTVVLEDYLEVRPEREPDLRRLVKAGRLLIGPWYVLPDEFLVSPEAIIRNFLLGHSIARKLGGVNQEGYNPDSFGHVAQLPQILAGFGLHSALFWRGVGDEGEELGNEFWWEAPDGTRVLACFLRHGYHNIANLGYPMLWGETRPFVPSADLALAQIRSAVDKLTPYARTSALLLVNGIDHADPQPEVPLFLQQANAKLDDVEVMHGTLSDYVRRVRAEAKELPVYRGEFNRGRYSVILQGVYSARMGIKQRNEQVQTLLERYAEPIAALATTLGAEYPSGLLATAWRHLLKNHPHDDICGCSVDQVHREDWYRFDQAAQIGQLVTREQWRVLTERLDHQGRQGTPLVVFHPLAWGRSGVIVGEVEFAPKDPRAESFMLRDEAGQPVPHQVLGVEERFSLEPLKPLPRRVARVAFPAQIPPCGYTTLYLTAGKPAQAQTDLKVLPNGAENQYLRLEIAANGTLRLTHKGTGRTFSGLLAFEDTEDAGDEYDYSPAVHTQTLTSQGNRARVRQVEAGPLRITYEVSLELPLPASLSADRKQRSAEQVPCSCSSLVTVTAGSPLVEVTTRFQNRVKDHRLRVRFPTSITGDRVYADGHFAVLERPITVPEVSGWAQPPVPTQHQRYFVDVNDGQAGLAVLNRGLPEYEIVPTAQGNEIALTLLRAVGYLSRGDLLTRPGNAGPWTMPAPEAQCLGEHIFHFAILLHQGEWSQVVRLAQEFAALPLLVRGDSRSGLLPEEFQSASLSRGGEAQLQEPLPASLPATHSFLALQPETLVLSALKRSEDGPDLIVRCYNCSPAPVTGRLRSAWPLRAATLVNLAEEPIQSLPVEDKHQVTLTARQWGIVTVRLEVETA